MARPRKTVRWQEGARSDLARIIETIARDNPDAADRLARVILKKVERLSDFPYLGSVSRFSRRIRHLFHKRYIIYYSVHRDEVVVRAIVHEAMRFRLEWFLRED